MRRPIPKAGCYSLAIVAAVAALLLREVLSPLLGVSYPFLTSWAAIILSAWYCGVGASIVCTLVCVVGVWYWFLPYLHSFALQNPRAEISGMAIFSVVAGTSAKQRI